MSNNEIENNSINFTLRNMKQACMVTIFQCTVFHDFL